MRRFFEIMLSAIIIAGLSVSCTSEPGAGSAVKVDMSFRAIAVDSETRTVLSDGTKVYWEPGDEISLCGAESPFVADIEVDSPEAVFRGKVEQSEHYYAAYPASAVIEWAGEIVQMSLPQTQTAVSGSFASGLNLTVSSTDDSQRCFQFHNILGLVSFTIGQDSGDITSVEIKTNAGEPICGDFLADCSLEKPVAVADTDTGSSVKLVSDAGLQPGVYYVAMIPGEYSEGLEFIFEGPQGQASRKVTRTLTLEPGCINHIGTVSGLQWQSDEVYYTRVSQNYDDWTGEYLITYSTSTSVKTFNTWASEDKGSSSIDLYSKLTSDGIPAADADKYKMVFEKVGDYYSIFHPGYGYLGLKSNSNALHKTLSSPSSSTKTYLWSVSYDIGNIRIVNASYTS